MKTMIQGYSFEISEPYAEGQTITAVEAKVLNQTRAENIGNNQRKAVQAAIEDVPPTTDEETGEPVPGQLSDEQVLELQNGVAAYDAEYTLSMTRSGRTRDPVAAMARTIARALVEKELKSQGKNLKQWREEVGDDVYNAKIAEVANKKKVIAHAKRTIELDV